MNILIAALEPEVSHDSAVLEQCMETIKGMDLEGHTLATLELPANWDECFRPMESLLRQDWDVVVCLAEKECEAIAVERIAINETNGMVKDRSGRRPRSKVIVPGGDPGYWSSLPYRDLTLALCEAKLEATSSHSAGMGLANHVFYRLMHVLSRLGRQTRAGLIQLPATGFDPRLAKRFMAVLVSCLSEAPGAEESLGVDVDALRSRSGLTPRSS